MNENAKWGKKAKLVDIVGKENVEDNNASLLAYS